ncbi:isocitrate lyase/phosphoenolpyruvate mutase family protein [Streptomyces sp. NPDC006384]|uniref:isocitrate lyase/phosphoenolpyruvate mutase family protein n=1 Tax=Streptomyces sp. NPDC006384 TaxID=3364745 RepID=UPI00367AC7A1
MLRRHTTVSLRAARARRRWVVASARVVDAAGAPAIATTSAGVAWSSGPPDGDFLTRDRAPELIGRIVAAVEAPVTTVIEDGYGQDAADVPGSPRSAGW